MSTKFPEPPKRCVFLPLEAWDAIRRDYIAGATAKALALKWKVAPKTIYARAARHGWSKKRNAKASVRAVAAASATAAGVTLPPEFPEQLYAPALYDGPDIAKHDRAPYPPPQELFAPDPRYWIERYSADEVYDAGLTARIAVSASAGAMIAGHLADAAVLAQIGYLHARIAKLNPQSFRARVLKVLMDERERDRLFCAVDFDGESRIKAEYDHWSRLQHEAEQRRAWALQRAEERIAELEARVAAGGP